MKNWKKFLWIFLASLLLTIAASPLRGGYITVAGLEGISLSTVVGGILFFLLTLYFLRRYSPVIRPAHILLAMLAGCAILELGVRIFNFQSSLISLPDSLSRLLAILLGYCFFKIPSRTGKIILVVCSLLLYLWIAYFGYSMWLNKLNYGTFTGRTEQAVSQPLIFQNTADENISLSDFRGRYVVLDFWNSTCGVCFRAFPDVQKIYDRYPDIEVHSVFCRMADRGETAQKGSEILRESGYTFPALSIDMKEAVLKEIGVRAFPTVIIFDPNGKLVFRGSIEYVKSFLDKTDK